MKWFLQMTFLLSVFNSYAQEALDTIPKVNGVYGYEEVVLLDSTYTKDLLYKNAKTYVANASKNASDVILDEKEEGKIISKGFYSIKDRVPSGMSDYKWNVYYNTEISFKDGKYRYRFYDIKIKQEIPPFYETKDMTVDEAIKSTMKGERKKLYTRMFNNMVGRFRTSVETLKKQLAWKDDF